MQTTAKPPQANRHHGEPQAAQATNQGAPMVRHGLRPAMQHRSNRALYVARDKDCKGYAKPVRAGVIQY